jgi:hypothetical protein
VLLDELSVDIVAASINATMENESLLIEMKSNAITAREVYNWEAEEKILLQFYQHLFS